MQFDSIEGIFPSKLLPQRELSSDCNFLYSRLQYLKNFSSDYSSSQRKETQDALRSALFENITLARRALLLHYSQTCFFQSDNLTSTELFDSAMKSPKPIIKKYSLSNAQAISCMFNLLYKKDQLFIDAILHYFSHDNKWEKIFAYSTFPSLYGFFTIDEFCHKGAIFIINSYQTNQQSELPDLLLSSFLLCSHPFIEGLWSSFYYQCTRVSHPQTPEQALQIIFQCISSATTLFSPHHHDLLLTIHSISTSRCHTILIDQFLIPTFEMWFTGNYLFLEKKLFDISKEALNMLRSMSYSEALLKAFVSTKSNGFVTPEKPLSSELVSIPFIFTDRDMIILLTALSVSFPESPYYLKSSDEKNSRPLFSKVLLPFLKSNQKIEDTGYDPFIYDLFDGINTPTYDPLKNADPEISRIWKLHRSELPKQIDYEFVFSEYVKSHQGSSSSSETPLNQAASQIQSKTKKIFQIIQKSDCYDEMMLYGLQSEVVNLESQILSLNDFLKTKMKIASYINYYPSIEPLYQSLVSRHCAEAIVIFDFPDGEIPMQCIGQSISMAVKSVFSIDWKHDLLYYPLFCAILDRFIPIPDKVIKTMEDDFNSIIRTRVQKKITGLMRNFQIEKEVMKSEIQNLKIAMNYPLGRRLYAMIQYARAVDVIDYHLIKDIGVKSAWLLFFEYGIIELNDKQILGTYLLLHHMLFIFKDIVKKWEEKISGDWTKFSVGMNKLIKEDPKFYAYCNKYNFDHPLK